MSVKRLVFCLGLVVLSLLAMSSTASAQSLFVLGGSAREDVDPEDGQVPINQVVSIDNSSDFGSITRNFGPNTSIKVKDLDNMLQVKYYFQAGKTCNAGSPRFQLRIDVDGSGPEPPRNAFGPISDSVFASACPLLHANKWIFEDMTNTTAKWDISQFANAPGGAPASGNAMIQTWQEIETYFQTNYPGHGVLSGSVVEDPTYTGGPPPGCTWYDNLTIKQNTMSTWADTAGVGGTCEPGSGSALGALGL